ncbi:hypothetical protein [Mongoliitalea daihaiensis]|uniref:hypothetical protein n=1 Tax=Mongoliitalea daihaiensis TaxID=2782006 RepID=UPI001F40B721|nr:hypothetical protein [Mongoliitalea daihaiensis]UJP66088.1 hypothetical protein IPZ59_05545 [Mongoliitalea daihaiensis]
MKTIILLICTLSLSAPLFTADDGKANVRAIPNVTAKSTQPVVFSQLEKIDFNQFRLKVNTLLPKDMTVHVYKNNKLVHEYQVENSTGFLKRYKIKGVNSRSKIEVILKTDDGFSQRLQL